MERSVGVVIPAYRPDTDRALAYVDALCDRVAPDVVRIELDDAAPDVVEALRGAPAPVEVNAVPDRRGKGAAITAGWEALDTDVLAFTDADGSTPAESVATVVDAVQAGADLAVGSRRHPNATIEGHQTVARRLMGDVFAWLARRLLDVGLYDFQCGTKAITRESWRRVRGHLYEPGFAWDVELVAIVGALGDHVVEVPISWEDQPGSTVSPLGTALSLGSGLLVARHRAKRIQDSPLHTAIANRREETALVDRR